MHLYKKTIILFTLFLGMFLVSCRKEQTNYETDKTAEQILKEVLKEQDSADQLEIMTDDSALHKDDLMEWYGLSQGIDSMAAARSIEAKADEIAVFHLEKKEDVKEAKEALESHLKVRESVFTGYFPLEAEKAKKGEVISAGLWLCLVVSDQSKAIDKAFYHAFSDQTEPENTPIVTKEITPTITEELTQSMAKEETSEIQQTEPTKEQKEIAKGMFDNHRIVTAYQKKDETILADENEKQLYEKAVSILAEIITDEMSDYEKEKAVHDYMIKHAEYDKEALKKDGKMREGADTPYGFLLHGYGICSGYTTTFQLFMDMLSIPCISIKASSGVIGHEEDHAWNMVELSGDWYYVDVTWDDPSGKDRVGYSFFNATTLKMLLSGHIWESNAYPIVSKFYEPAETKQSLAN